MSEGEKTTSPVVILIHWLVRKGCERAFEDFWRGMSVKHGSGLYRELLTTPLTCADPKFNTFSITNTSYSTYINIGIWRSICDFDRAIGAYIPPTAETPDPVTGRRRRSITLEDFEFKIRERIVLQTVSARSGGLDLPATAL